MNTEQTGDKRYETQEIQQSKLFPESLGIICGIPNKQFVQETLKNVHDVGISIDLETPVNRGTGIFSVGIVPFSEEKEKVFHELAFYVRFDFVQVMESGDFNASTLRWWLLQEKEAIKEIVHTSIEPTSIAGRVAEKCLPRAAYVQGLSMVKVYIELLKECARIDAKIFPLGNGKEFDVRILEDTWIKHGIVGKNWKGEYEFPWNFWEPLDLRERVSDVKLATGVDIKKLVSRKGVHHNAVDDATYQAEVYIEGTKLLSQCRELFRAATAKPEQETE